MYLFEFLTESEIPPTIYGYWITDQGQIIPVGSMQHGFVARQHDFKGGTEDALEHGWIRIVCRDVIYNRSRFYAEMVNDNSSRRAISSLRRLVTDQPYDSYVASFVGIGYQSTDNAGEFMRVVQKYVAPRNASGLT
jgi:hypothetical protein